ncbi:MAG: hypothetical protein IT424_13645, partial [Pirellulales bacterium]|nr:hypothetical protein [Pirellulales bacterium]
RSYPAALPDGENRILDLRWFWDYEIEPGSEFRVRIRLSPTEAVGSSLSGFTQELNFAVSGATSGFELHQMALSVPDSIRSFDISFISGGSMAAIGTLYVDDVSAALVAPTALPGDYDLDNDVDGADLLVWQQYFGATVLPGTGPDGDRNGVVDSGDLAVWKSGFGNVGSMAAFSRGGAAPIPEPDALALANSVWLLCWAAQRRAGPWTRGISAGRAV